MTTEAPAASANEPKPSELIAWPSAGRAWYAVFVCSLALMINFLDRTMLGLLVPSIKMDLHLSDMQMSLLIGFAFILIYVFLMFPVARAADIGNRRSIIGIGIGLWSLATAFCGIAQNFWQLFICRVFTGIGEACNGPATFSLLGDYFPREKLARAIAVMNFGFMVGTGLALIIGGALIGLLASLPPLELPIVGTLKTWQTAFLVVGLPGLIVSAMLWTVREPVRRGRLLKGTRPVAVPLGDVVRFIWDNRRVYGPMLLGLAFNTVHAIGVLNWAPAFFNRTYGWSMPVIGMLSGLTLLVVWPLGAMFGSWLAEHFQKKGHDDANLRVVVWAIVLLLPGQILFPLMPSAEYSFGINAVNGFIAAWVLGPQNAAIQVVTPNELRGQISALGIFIINVIGYGLGPLLITTLTAVVFGSEQYLGRGMALASALMGPLAAFTIWWGMKEYAAALARARKQWD